MNQRTSEVRDAQGVKRPVALYQATTPFIDRLRTALGQSRYWLEPETFAKKKDRDILAKVMRDPVVYKAIMLRLHVCASAEWYFEPADRASRALVPYFDAIFRRIPNFAQARLALGQAILEGISFLRILGAESKFSVDGDPQTNLRWWYPGHLAHIGADAIKREKRIERLADPEGAPYDKEVYYWTTFDAHANAFLQITPEQEPWYVKLIYHDDQGSLGFGRGLLDALYIYFHAKTQLLTDMLQGASKFGRPWIHLGIPAGGADGFSGVDDGTGMDSPETAADDLIEKIKQMEGSNILVTDARIKLTTLDFNGESARGLLYLIEYIDKMMVEMILGSSMPTGGGDQGSYARAAVEQQTTSDLVRFDRIAMEEAMATLVKSVWDFNIRNFAGLTTTDGRFLNTLTPPRFRLRDYGEKPDPEAVGAALQLGLPVRREEAYRAFGLSQPDADDDVIQPPGAGGGPMGAPGVDGPAADLYGNPARGANETVPGDGLVM